MSPPPSSKATAYVATAHEASWRDSIHTRVLDSCLNEDSSHLEDFAGRFRQDLNLNVPHEHVPQYAQITPHLQFAKATLTTRQNVARNQTVPINAPLGQNRHILSSPLGFASTGQFSSNTDNIEYALDAFYETCDKPSEDWDWETIFNPKPPQAALCSHVTTEAAYERLELIMGHLKAA